MTAAATPASEGRGADHGRPAIGARSARRNDTPIRWRFLVIQEHHESFDRPLRGRCPDGLFVRPRGLRCRRREPESARPVSGNLSAVKRVSGLRGATCCWAAGLAFIVMAVNALPAFAGSEGRTSGWAGTYAAAFFAAVRRKSDGRSAPVSSCRWPHAGRSGSTVRIWTSAARPIA